MAHILTETLKANVGKAVLIFLHNRFRYRGVIKEVDDQFVVINDLQKGMTILKIIDIAEVQFPTKEGI